MQQIYILIPLKDKELENKTTSNENPQQTPIKQKPTKKDTNH